MRTLAMATLVAALFAWTGADAAQMSAKDKCLQDLKDAKVNLTKTEDTGRPGEKIEKEAKELFPVVEALCSAGKYAEAKQLVDFLRHLLAD